MQADGAYSAPTIARPPNVIDLREWATSHEDQQAFAQDECAPPEDQVLRVIVAALVDQLPSAAKGAFLDSLKRLAPRSLAAAVAAERMERAINAR